MKYLILFLLVMFSCNVNAENIKELHQKWWDYIRETNTDGYSYSCLTPNIYGKVNYTNHNCFMTYYMLLNESNYIDPRKKESIGIKNSLDIIRLKKHICADLLAKKSDYAIESYKYFCTNLENEQRIYEYYKNECMKNRPIDPLVCFSYKFE